MKKLMILLFFVILMQPVEANIVLEKTYYKPSETMEIKLNYSEPLIDVKFTILKPDGFLETPTPISMVSVDSYWGYNYTFKPSSMNGTYVINISASQGSEIINASSPSLEFNKTFDIVAWKLNYFLNKYSFKPNETVNLNLTITEKYSERLKFNVFYSMMDVNRKEVDSSNITLAETQKGFFKSYKIPANYAPGWSTIKIFLSDSDFRNTTINMSFYVSNAFYRPSNQTTTEPTTQDYSYIIWYFAIGIAAIIILITVLRYRKIKKRKEAEERRKKEAEMQDKEIYTKPSDGSYRTEYY